MRSAASIRRAVPADLETLRRFEQGIIAAERPFDPTIRKDSVAYYDIEALIASAETYVAIAEVDGEAIGCGFVRRTPSRTFTEPPFKAYVGLMFVAPEHRGNGVSGLILAALKDWARANGLTEMRLEVYPENTGAMRAYEAAGFTPYMLEMRLALGE